MAGTNQSTNLTGMLSQIGDTLGRERDISSLTRGIENMSRPDINKPNGMMRVADWQNRMGRPQEAAATVAMQQEKRLQEAAVKAEQDVANNDAFYNYHTDRLAERNKIVADPKRLGELAAFDAETATMRAVGPKQQAMLKDFNATAEKQNGVATTTKTNADVSYVDSLDRFIAREDVDPSVRAAAERKKQEYLNKPGVREALATRADQNAKIAENEAKVTELQAQQEGEKAIREAFSSGGLEAAAEVAADHPAADAVFKAIKEAEEVSQKYKAMPDTVAANTQLATDITASITSLPENVPATVREGFKNQLKAIEAQGNIPGQASVAQERMLSLYRAVGELNTRVILAKQAGDASAAAGRQATVDAIDTSTASTTQLAVAAQALKIPWSQALADIASGKSSGSGPAAENYRLIQEVARDLRLTPEMGQRFERNPDGSIKMEGGQPVENPNFEAERAAYIGSPSTAPSNPDGLPEGYVPVNNQ